MRAKKFFPYLLCSLLIIVVVFVFCKLTLVNVQIDEVIELNDGWELIVNNSVYSDVTMTTLYKSYNKTIETGDHIILKHKLPDSNVPNPVIMFKTKYTSLNCYLDGKRLYSFGDDYIKAGKFLGKMYHVISLPTDYAGKTIVFDMTAGEYNSFNFFTPPVVGSHPDVTGKFVSDNLIIIATGLFTFMFGLTFLCIAMVFVNFVPEVKSL